jgi:hypothetical protein
VIVDWWLTYFIQIHDCNMTRTNYMNLTYPIQMHD